MTTEEESLPPEVERDFLSLMTTLEDFEREHSIRKGFNVFEALNITRQEIRHSRFLAYLLNPGETHGLDDKFLRAILRTVLSENQECSVSQLEVALEDLSDASVYCERDHFDISIQIPALNLLFVIENKVGATERESQLEDYGRRAKERYGEYKFLGCFLTPNGYEGADGSWLTLSYGKVCEELVHLLEQETLAQDVSVAIQHYIELVQRRIMATPKLITACRQIYIKHRAAIDLIIEHGQQSVLASAFERFTENHAGIEKSSLRSNMVFFHHQSWLQIPDRPQAMRSSTWTSDFPVRFWFRLEEARLSICVVVGPLLSPSSEESWNQLVKVMLERFGGGTHRGKKRARIKLIGIDLNEDSSVDDVASAMEKAWEKLAEGNGSDVVRTAVIDWIDLQKEGARADAH